MPDFSALAARMDTVIYARLSDLVTLDGAPLRGMFSTPWLQPRMGAMRTGFVEPLLVVRDADSAGAAEGSVVEAGGKTFDVVSVEPDGTGLTTLVLREVQP